MTPASHVTAAARPSPLARVRGLGDLAALLPYLMGFVPAESVTCVALRERRVGLTARVDLPAVLDPLTGPALLDSVFGSIARTDAHRVIAIVSSEAADLDPALVGLVQGAADRAGVELSDLGWHRAGWCSSLLCEDPLCCPPGGVPVDTACPAAATATFAGVSVRAARADVEAEFARPPGVDPTALDPLIGDHETAALRAVVGGDPGFAPLGAARVIALARSHDARAAAGTPVEPLTDGEVASCVAALADIAVRDAVWIAVDAREIHGQGLWLELAHRAPAPYDASPLFLLGWRSWRHGDGVRAVIAAERAQASAGEYSAARLLLDAVAACVDPRSVPSLSGVPGPAARRWLRWRGRTG